MEKNNREFLWKGVVVEYIINEEPDFILEIKSK